MSKPNITKMANGFKVSKSEKQIEKEAREERILARKSMKKSSVTNTEIFEFLQDTNDRLSEIYDLLKATQ